MFLRDSTVGGGEHACRYGNSATKAFGELAEVIWSRGESDWQGDAAMLLRLASAYVNCHPKFVYYSWSWGSCSGCDEWEARGLSDREIAIGMTFAAQQMDAGEMRRFLHLDDAANVEGDVAAARDAFRDWLAENRPPAEDAHRCLRHKLLPRDALPMFVEPFCFCSKGQ